jgi:hypothetical protein
MEPGNWHDCRKESVAGLAPRLLAAGWFGAAAAIPASAAFLWAAIQVFRSSGTGEGIGAIFWFLFELPVVSAAFVGFAIGARIVNGSFGEARGALQGVLIAILSYVLFVASWTLGLVALSGRDISVNSMMFVVFVAFLGAVYGAVLLGWLLLGIGALAGMMLVRFSRWRGFVESGIMRSHTTCANLVLWYFVTGVLLGVNATLPFIVTPHH